MSFFELVQSYGIVALTVLAFAVNLIVELTKGVGFLKRIPTDAYVIVISLLLCAVAYFAVIGIFSIPFVWYELIIAIIAGFLVAFISMYGWEKLTELWNRFKK